MRFVQTAWTISRLTRNPNPDPRTQPRVVFFCLPDRIKCEVIREGEWEMKGNTGLKYAAVVNDWNPIHLYGWSAKLFGFPKPIAHGNYVCAKALHEALEEWGKAGERGRPDS